MEHLDCSIDLLWQEGVRDEYVNAAESTLRTVCRHLGIEERLPVVRIGAWRAEDESESVERILEDAKSDAAKAEFQPGQLHAMSIRPRMIRAPWRPHAWRGFSLLLVREDYACPGEEYVFGFATPGWCATVSTYRYERDTRVQDPIATFVTTVFHEFGHVVGAPDGSRKEALEDWLGMHCTNACVMRQRDDLPEWEADIVKDLFEGKLYCSLCLADIQLFLAHHLPLSPREG